MGVRAPDPSTLEVTLENPTPFFLDLCAFTTLLPVHRAMAEKYPDWSSKPEHFVGNGPFLLREWLPFDHLRLVKNPRYWDAAHDSSRASTSSLRRGPIPRSIFTRRASRTS